MVTPRARRGYTLVEVIVAVGLIGIFSMVAPRLFLEVTRYLRMSRAHYEIQRDSKNALLVINRALRQSRASTITVSNRPNQPPYSRIQFDKYVSDGVSQSISFYQEGDALFQVDQGRTREVCRNLRYIAFTYPRTDDSYILSVSITMERATYEGQSKALHLAVEKVRIMNP